MLDILNKDDYRADSVHKNLVIELDDGTTIDNTNIKSESMKLNEILMDVEQLKYGRCNSSQFIITLADVVANIKGRVIKARIEIGDNVLPLGVFTVKEVPRLSQTPYKQITALDNMHKIDRDVTEWYNSLSFPMTQKAFRDSFFAYIGLEQVETTLLFDDLEINNPFADVGQINGRTIAEGLCELNARFGHCDREGRFKYVGLKYDGLYPSPTLYPSPNLYPGMLKFPSDSNEVIEDLNKLYIRASYDEYATQYIDRIMVIDDFGMQVSNNNTGSNTYVLNNNYLLYGRENSELIDIMNKFMSVVRTQSYRPATIESKGLPYVELGDRVKLNAGDDEILTYVFNRTLTGIQALRDTYTADGEEYLINDLNSIQSKIETLNRSNDRLKVEITKTSEGLKSKVSKGEVSTEISQEEDEVRITGNRFIVDADNLEITKDGKLTANEAVILGDLTGYEKLKLFNVWNQSTVDVLVADNTTDTQQLKLYGLDGRIMLSLVGISDQALGGRAIYSYENLIVGINSSNPANFVCYGTKSRAINTNNYNTRLEYCYEMPTPYFGDVGEGITDNDGICYIFLDDIFAETIDVNCEYQVFLQAYGEGTVYVNERNCSYFIVKGTPNMKFAWELKAVQRDYEMYRLDEPTQQAEETTDYAEESYDYLASLLYDVEQESEVIINE